MYYFRYEDLFELYAQKIQNDFPVGVTVVFDTYGTASPKDSTHLRRTNGRVSSIGNLSTKHAFYVAF